MHSRSIKLNYSHQNPKLFITANQETFEMKVYFQDENYKVGAYLEKHNNMLFDPQFFGQDVCRPSIQKDS